jgi:ABC-type transport system involved in cytochrome c biogenesis permease subunit
MSRAAAVAAMLLASTAGAAELFDDQTVAFLREVDGDALRRLGVAHRGRVTILDTHARDRLAQALGTARFDDTPPASALMELYCRSGFYLRRPVLYVREKTMRAFCRDALRKLAGRAEAEGADPDAARAIRRAADDFERTDRLPPAAIVGQTGLEVLLVTGRLDLADLAEASKIPSLRRDLRRLRSRREFAVPIERLQRRHEGFIQRGDQGLRILPTARGPWQALRHVCRTLDDANADVARLPSGIDAAFKALRDAWRRHDAEAVNRLLGEFAAAQRRADTRGLLPSPAAAALELAYNRTAHFTVAWVGFALALVAMTVAAALGPRRRLPRRVGLGLLAASAAVLLAGFVIRWVLSGRAWYLPPIMNSFEALTGSALLAALLTLALELVQKRNYLALAAAFYATVALLACFFLPRWLPARGFEGALAAPFGILNSPVMAAHVAVIIVGHAFVAMAAVISALYLLAAAFRPRGPRRRAAAGGPDLVGPPPAAPLAGIDRCNLLAAQLAAWTVALGTALGAYWGDAAWGRWWGWDPKETWALITALILLAVVHLRFAVPRRYRGVLTAAGCLLACGAMLFNWIVVNFLLPGLHSYA